eukprot:m.129158 g.129158  ORF g.129158 m.129158 type:complete len:723 (+) comp37964_c0_seq1:166-2334(+)
MDMTGHARPDPTPVKVKFLIKNFEEAFLLSGKKLVKAEVTLEEFLAFDECPVDELCTLAGQFLQEKDEVAVADGSGLSESIGQSIHCLLDNLIKSDICFSLEIMWIVGRELEDMNLKSHLCLYGALERCREWHHGSIIIVHGDNLSREKIEYLKTWVCSLHALLIPWNVFSSMAGIRQVWTGSLVFTECQLAESFLSIPGFSMIAFNEHFYMPFLKFEVPGCLEIIKILDSKCLPLYWLSGHSLSLCLNESTNVSSVDKLRDTLVSSSACLLARVKCFEDSEERQQSSMLTEDWISYVCMKGNPTFNSGQSEWEEDNSGPVLVLLPCVSDATVKFKVYFIQQSSFFDTMLVERLDDDNATPLSVSALSGLIDFQENNEILVENDRLLIRREEFSTELDVEPDDWPEVKWWRKVVKIQNEMSDSLSPLQRDMMIIDGKLFSPPTQVSEVCVDESVLEKFNTDGRPVSLSLSPITARTSSKGKGLRKFHTFDSSTLKSLSYHDTLGLSVHGIDYCVDGMSSLTTDLRLTRLQSRYVCNETNSTCVPASTPVVKLGKRRAMTCVTPCGSRPEVKRKRRLLSTPTRKSPRKHVAKTRRKLCTKTTSSKFLEGDRKIDTEKQPADCGSLKRSERHKQRLQKVVRATLKWAKLSSKHACFKQCCQRLFDVCLGYLKDLKTSKNLGEEMKRIAKDNVQQVINFELGQASSCKIAKSTQVVKEAVSQPEN